MKLPRAKTESGRTITSAMNFLYDLLVHKMIGRNLRFIRSGITYRWFFVAFWICFAAFALTNWTALGILCGILLFCSVVARILWQRKLRADMQQLIKDKDNS
jgi:hypothetical protein